MTGIYKIESPSGNVYIGQSRNIEKRWFQHRSERRKSDIYPLVHSLIKYGNAAHSFEVVHELPTDIEQVYLDRIEQAFIDLYKDSGKILLNIRHAGSIGQHSEETKNKIRLTLIKNGKTKEHLEKIILKNKSRTGYKMSDEIRKKIAEKARKRNKKTRGFTGRKHSEESKKKISLSSINKPDPPETKLIKSIAAKKRWENKKGGNLGF